MESSKIEVYQDQFRPWIPHVVVAADDEDKWTTPAILCYSIFHLQRRNDMYYANMTNMVMTSGLIANGFIEKMMEVH